MNGGQGHLSNVAILHVCTQSNKINEAYILKEHAELKKQSQEYELPYL